MADNEIAVQQGAFRVVYTPYNKIRVYHNPAYYDSNAKQEVLLKTFGMAECADLVKALRDFLYEFESRAAKGLLPKPE